MTHTLQKNYETYIQSPHVFTETANGSPELICSHWHGNSLLTAAHTLSRSYYHYYVEIYTGRIAISMCYIVGGVVRSCKTKNRKSFSWCVCWCFVKIYAREGTSN